MKRLQGIPSRLAAPRGRLASTATAGSGFVRNDGKTTTERGYGADWRKVRAGVLRREPWCRLCRTEGVFRHASEVDHIQPFHGAADPRRLDPSNLRPLCVAHHRSRTALQAHGAG